jgi:hypothetical protein
MRYFEALLSRESARTRTVGLASGGDKPAPDKSDNSPAAPHRTALVGYVGAPEARPPTYLSDPDPDCRRACARSEWLFDASWWGVEDFEERAAILEYDGGLDRAVAERLAIDEIADRSSYGGA